MAPKWLVAAASTGGYRKGTLQHSPYSKYLKDKVELEVGATKHARWVPPSKHTYSKLPLALVGICKNQKKHPLPKLPLGD